MPQQIVRTEDVIECLDDRILASQDHPSISILTGENYSSVLSKIETQICSPGQKAAIAATLTAPDALNPIVLKDDIDTYYPQLDLGEIKDAVATLGDLPPSGNPNDLIPVLDIGAIYRWDATVLPSGAWVPFIRTGTIDHTQMSAQNGDPNYIHISLSDLSVILSQKHTHANKLAVLDPITNAGSGVVISTAERARIPSADEKDALDDPSGLRIPFDPNPPSSTDKFVTSIDPRLNTIRNPYITFGLPGTAATFTGSDITDLEVALASLATGGSTEFINALEILPSDVLRNQAIYDLNTVNYQGIVWSDVKQLLIEGMASRAGVFKLAPQPAGSTAFLISPNGIFTFTVTLANATAGAVYTHNGYNFTVVTTISGELTLSCASIGLSLSSGTLTKSSGTGDSTIAFSSVSYASGKVVVRGITFELGGTDVLGALIERDDTIFEDCTFTTSTPPPTITGAIGIRVNANNVNIRRCIFSGNLVQGIDVLGNNCLIESCRFDLASTPYPAVTVSGNYCQVTSGIISRGTLQVNALAQDAIFDKNRMTVNTAFIDAGVNTRWLGGISQDFQQAYIGRTRTVGPINSHADFRGTSETPFVAAIFDPYTTEIEILEGSYAFTAPVTVLAGKSLKTVRGGAVYITGANCFILNSSTKLEGFTLTSTGASAITATGVSDIEIKNCTLIANTNDSINASGVSDFKVTHCQLTGMRGITLTGDIRSKITHNVFSNNTYSVQTDLTTADLHYADNTEEGSVCFLAGTNGIIRGNHFLGTLPSKLNTTGTLWVGNYPPETNNTNGIDIITVATDSLLCPVLDTGTHRSSFLGTASIAFGETGTPTAVTSPIFIGAKIDRTKGYTVKLSWTAAVFSGSVLWEVSMVFRERGTDLGTSTIKTLLSPRTNYTVGKEEILTFSFSSAEYGYGALVDPTHVALVIRRLGADATDTLPGIAYLTEAAIILPRD